MSNQNATIARNLRFLREEQGLSVDDLAKLTHIGHSTIGEIELNQKKRAINPDYIPLFAKALRVKQDVLTESNEEINTKLEALRARLKAKDFGRETERLADELIKDTEKRGPLERALVFLRRGTLFYNRAMYSVALDNYSKSLDYASAIPQHEIRHQARHNLASAYMMIGCYDKVDALITEDLNELEDLQKKSRDYFLLGRSKLKRKMWDEARQHMQSAIESIRECGVYDTAFTARCNQILGDIYRSMNDFTEAGRSCEIALQLAVNCGDTLCKIYSQKTLALCLYEIGQEDKALGMFRSAKAEIEQNEDISESEALIVDFYIARCANDYLAMKKAVLSLEQYEVEPRDFAVMLEATARMAMLKGHIQEAQQLYEKAIKLLLN